MVIAGPCSLTSYTQGLDNAKVCKKYGVDYFRAGAFKPRTSPYSYQGLREEGLEILSRIKYEIDIKVITELIDIEYLPLYQDVDIIQIGSRNCQNFELLKKVAQKTDKPILLKRGFGMTIKEFIEAAKYLEVYGASEIILCERGIKTFEDSTRNTIDFAAIPIIQRETDYKIIVDPSHGTGRQDLVLPMARAAMGIGADGIMVEVERHPESAWTDAKQQINYQQLAELMHFCK